MPKKLLVKIQSKTHKTRNTRNKKNIKKHRGGKYSKKNTLFQSGGSDLKLSMHKIEYDRLTEVEKNKYEIISYKLKDDYIDDYYAQEYRKEEEQRKLLKHIKNNPPQTLTESEYLEYSKLFPNFKDLYEQTFDSTQNSMAIQLGYANKYKLKPQLHYNSQPFTIDNLPSTTTSLSNIPKGFQYLYKQTFDPKQNTMAIQRGNSDIYVLDRLKLKKSSSQANNVTLSLEDIEKKELIQNIYKKLVDHLDFIFQNEYTNLNYPSYFYTDTPIELNKTKRFKDVSETCKGYSLSPLSDIKYMLSLKKLNIFNTSIDNLIEKTKPNITKYKKFINFDIITNDEHSHIKNYFYRDLYIFTIFDKTTYYNSKRFGNIKPIVDFYKLKPFCELYKSLDKINDDVDAHISTLEKNNKIALSTLTIIPKPTPNRFGFGFF
jgi:hypothetical protein